MNQWGLLGGEYMDKLILNAYRIHTNRKSRIGKCPPPFFKKMLKGGTGLKVKFINLHFGIL